MSAEIVSINRLRGMPMGAAKLVRLAMASALAIGIVLAPTPGVRLASAAGVEVTSTATTERYKLGLNKSMIINLPADAYDILVANPMVADAVTRTARRIYIFGKAVGETNIFVFGQNGEQIASFDLAIERDVAGLEEQIRRFIPGSDVKVELINDNVVLTGTVETPLDAKRAQELAQMLVKGGEATTGQYSQPGASASGGGIVVGGDDDDEARQTSAIKNFITIIGEDQVTLKVTVAEVSRSVMKQLNVSLTGSGSSNGISWGSSVYNPVGLGAPMGGNRANFRTSSLQGTLEAIDAAGAMKTLAEPTLTAVSGEPATFQVGGSIQIPQNYSQDEETGGGTISYAREEYGIMLQFRPVVLSPGRISLRIRTAVSEPMFEGSALNLGTLPGIRKRLADTTVELPSGGSMMIAGLIRDDVRQAYSGVPGISKIPVLGSLFRSRDFIRNETELVVIVTPYLSKPVARADLAKPDDNFNPTGDGAGMFLGRVNRVYGTMKTDKPNGRYHGAVGFIYK